MGGLNSKDAAAVSAPKSFDFCKLEAVVITIWLEISYQVSIHSVLEFDLLGEALSAISGGQLKWNPKALHAKKEFGKKPIFGPVLLGCIPVPPELVKVYKMLFTSNCECGIEKAFEEYVNVLGDVYDDDDGGDVGRDVGAYYGEVEKYLARRYKLEAKLKKVFDRY